jgi:hypothetical protein
MMLMFASSKKQKRQGEHPRLHTRKRGGEKKHSTELGFEKVPVQYKDLNEHTVCNHEIFLTNSKPSEGLNTFLLGDIIQVLIKIHNQLLPMLRYVVT